MSITMALVDVFGSGLHASRDEAAMAVAAPAEPELGRRYTMADVDAAQAAAGGVVATDSMPDTSANLYPIDEQPWEKVKNRDVLYVMGTRDVLAKNYREGTIGGLRAWRVALVLHGLRKEVPRLRTVNRAERMLSCILMANARAGLNEPIEEETGHVSCVALSPRAEREAMTVSLHMATLRGDHDDIALLESALTAFDARYPDLLQ